MLRCSTRVTELGLCNVPDCRPSFVCPNRRKSERNCPKLARCGPHAAIDRNPSNLTEFGPSSRKLWATSTNIGLLGPGIGQSKLNSTDLGPTRKNRPKLVRNRPRPESARNRPNAGFDQTGKDFGRRRPKYTGVCCVDNIQMCTCAQTYLCTYMQIHMSMSAHAHNVYMTCVYMHARNISIRI